MAEFTPEQKKKILADLEVTKNGIKQLCEDVNYYHKQTGGTARYKVRFDDFSERLLQAIQTIESLTTQ